MNHLVRQSINQFAKQSRTAKHGNVIRASTNL